MTRSLASRTFTTLIVLLAAGPCDLALAQDAGPAPAAHEGLLYGRVTTEDGAAYEGRLRFGGDEEALWGNYFNGFKQENPWAAYAPLEPPIEVFGIAIPGTRRQGDSGRPFMARFGDISRIEPRGREIRVVQKSGTGFVLDRYSADDLADGVRVWDDARGVVDLDEWQIRSIEFLSTASIDAAPAPLHGTVRTRQGEFTGLIQWDRTQCLAPDELGGNTADGFRNLRFDTIRSIARSAQGSLVTLLDGREIALAGTSDVGEGNRGVYVDDPRFGRVLISWDAFERVDFSAGGTGPAYGDFPPARPLAGHVVTLSGRRLSGRLVFDLDESETIETLDAPALGVDYTIPFALVASVALRGAEEGGAERARVTLQSGEVLDLERAGDLGERNGGLLIFLDGQQSPEYVPWPDVGQIDFDRAG